MFRYLGVLGINGVDVFMGMRNIIAIFCVCCAFLLSCTTDGGVDVQFDYPIPTSDIRAERGNKIFGGDIYMALDDVGGGMTVGVLKTSGDDDGDSDSRSDMIGGGSADESVLHYISGGSGSKKSKEDRKIAMGSVSVSRGIKRSSESLWLASLNVLSFVPIAIADHRGGLLLTEWYQVNSKSDDGHRYKIHVAISSGGGGNASTSSIVVRAFKEERKTGEDGNDLWYSMSVPDAVSQKIKEQIIAKAAQIESSGGLSRG